MIAEFTVESVTMVASGGTQLKLMPVGEPGFMFLELEEPAEDGTLGSAKVELAEGTKYVPRPGETVRLQMRKVRGGGRLMASNFQGRGAELLAA